MSKEITNTEDLIDTHIEETVNIDNSKLSMEELIARIGLLSKSKNPYNVSKEILEIKSLFYIKLKLKNREEVAAKDDELQQNLKQELHPLEIKFKAIYDTYRNIKANFRKNREKEEAKNLKTKKKIIADIDLLAKEEESLKITFEKFRALQDKWKNTGNVAITENNHLWQSYHHHIELFYDFIKINKDLRDLDFKRNLEEKSKICEKAESLLQERSINQAHNKLQELHEHWKNVGPVEIQKREPLWGKFQEISRKINKKKNDYFIQRKRQDSIKLEAKHAISIEIETLTSKEISTHNKWQEATTKCLELENKWKSLGGINKKDNKVAWKRLRSSLSNFYNTKNAFYKQKKEHKKQILEKKIEFCKEAEKLQNSNDWKNTGKKLIKLQEEWKESNLSYYSETNEMWQKFKFSCDTFFQRRKAHYKEIKEKEETVYQKQKELLKKMENLKISPNTKEEIKKIEGIKKEWLEISNNSKGKKDVNNKFLSLLNSKLTGLGLKKKKLATEQYKNKADLLRINSKEINSERESLRKKITTLKQEINQYENNISFFGHGKATEQLMLQTQKRIETTRSNIEDLKQKIKLLNKS